MADIHAVTVPKWGIEMQEGTIIAWHLNEGDAVNKGDALIDIETDKIVNTLEAPAGGVLRRRLIAQDETLNVGALLGVIATAETDDARIDTFIAEFKPADAAFAFTDEDNAAASGQGQASPSTAPPQAVVAADNDKPRASPAAARLAHKLGVDLGQVQGSGRGGRISTEDVAAFAQHNDKNDTGHETEAGQHMVIPISPRRKLIARKLVEAKQQIPHFYLTADIAMDAALAYRQSINHTNNSPISVNDLLLRACVLALQAMPEVNIQVQDETIRQFKHVNIAIAVATDDGLLTPVIHQAEALSLTGLAKQAKELSRRARDNTLEPGALRQGTFTLSNLGMFGIKAFQGVINAPQAALLAAGSVRRQVVAEADDIRIANMMSVSLSCDHRALDGVAGAKFLQQIKTVLQQPAGLD